MIYVASRYKRTGLLYNAAKNVTYPRVSPAGYSLTRKHGSNIYIYRQTDRQTETVRQTDRV